MKRQYMDFVPTKSTNTPTVHTKKLATPVITTHKTTKISSTTSHQVYTTPTRIMPGESMARHASIARSSSRKVASSRKVTPSRSASAVQNTAAPALGVIEDLSPRTDAASSRQSIVRSSTQDRDSLKTIKSQKVGKRASVKPVENHVENSAKKPLESGSKRTFVPPKFINQDKITKRPLSKNIYRKKIEPAKESSKKPITIIAKPEKNTKAGIIVAIIITIILGATAGTVAFLLLPK